MDSRTQGEKSGGVEVTPLVTMDLELDRDTKEGFKAETKCKEGSLSP